jgi:zinc transport system substrate-binding protein
MKRLPAIAALVAAAPLALTGCGSDADAGGGGGVEVLAAFYPLAFVADRVGGDQVQVDNLTQPGAEPHDLELTGKQVGEIAEADLVLYLEGFQPAVDEAIEQNAAEAALEVSEVVPLEETGAGHDHGHDRGHDHGDEEAAHEEELEGDPHLWLDPTRLIPLADAVAERLAQTDQEGAATYRANAAALTAELETLDREFEAGLATCDRRTFVTSHEAFGYLAHRYDLEMVGISGLNPEAEPSPARVREVQELVGREGVDTIFYETLVSPKVAETIAGDLGLRAAVLDPIEGLTDGNADSDYLSLMRANLEALRTANGCR